MFPITLLVMVEIKQLFTEFFCWTSAGPCTGIIILDVLLMEGLLLVRFRDAFGVIDLMLLERSVRVVGTTFLGEFLLGCGERTVSLFVVRETIFRGAVLVKIVQTSC